MLYVACCGETSLAVMKSGACYVWGKIGKETEIKPTLIQKFNKEMQIVQARISYKNLLIAISHHNTKTLKFASFHPLSIQCGTSDRLMRWLLENQPNMEIYIFTFLRTFRRFINAKRFILFLAIKSLHFFFYFFYLFFIYLFFLNKKII